MTYEHELAWLGARRAAGAAWCGAPAGIAPAARHTHATAPLTPPSTRDLTPTLHKTLVNRQHKTFLSDSHLVSNGNVESGRRDFHTNVIKRKREQY